MKFYFFLFLLELSLIAKGQNESETNLVSTTPTNTGCEIHLEAETSGKKTTVYSKVLVALGYYGEAIADVEIIDLLSSKTTCRKPQNFPYGNYRASGGLGFKEKPLICGGVNSSRAACHLYEDGVWKSSDTLNQERFLFHGRSKQSLTGGFDLDYSGEWDESDWSTSEGGKWAFAMTQSPFQDGCSKLFLTGGWDGSYSWSSSQVLTNNGWQASVPLPDSVNGHCMVTVNSSTVMVIGGHKSKNTFLFNSEINIWTKGPKLNRARASHSCGSIRKNSQTKDKSLIAIGGWHVSRLSSVEVLDLDLSAWRRGPDLPFAIEDAAMVEDPSGGVVLIGGYGEGKGELDTLYRLPNAGSDSTWELMSQKLKRKRNYLTAFLIPDDIAACN